MNLSINSIMHPDETDKIRRLIFTRYLYVKDEVFYSLLMSLLDQNVEEALFWTYEIYYSGFKNKIFEFVIKIFYDFYSVLNPNMEKWIIKKMHEWYDSYDDSIIGTIVNNIALRKSNMDFFILINYIDTLRNQGFTENVITKMTLDCVKHGYGYKNFINIIMCKDNSEYIKKYNELPKTIINKSQNNISSLIEILNMIDCDCNTIFYITRSACCNKILNLLKIDNDKKIFLALTYNDIKGYKTLLSNEGRARKILPKAYKYSIRYDGESLFHFARCDIESLQKEYYYHWIYHASFTPIWSNRIHKYNGIISHEKKDVIFENEDEYELFYQWFNYEPDEQTKEIQECAICTFHGDIKWSDICKKYNNNSIIESYDIINFEKIKYLL